MFLRILTTLFCLVTTAVSAYADINPMATYTDSKGTEITEWKNITGDAPLHVRFEANASSLEANASLEWHIRHRTSGTSLTRYEHDFEFDFTEAGITVVSLYVLQDNELVDSTSIDVTISQSHLEMPNAFSPNNDGHNDYYGAKGIRINKTDETVASTGQYKSIVEFHAYIFNRWGQKLYEWTDIEGYWDGTFNGQPVKDGVYYVLVKARGADGVEYDIRRDVNLIRRYNETTSGSAGGGNE